MIDYEGNIYFGSSDGFLYALNEDGSELWKIRISEEDDCSIKISLGNSGGLYVVGGKTNFYGLNMNGEILRKFQIEARNLNWYSNIYNNLTVCLIVSHDGLIFVESNFREYYVFKEFNEFGSADKYPQWPTIKGSNKRIGRPLLNNITDIKNSEEDLYTTYKLFHNHPNPFNPATTISYSLVHPGLVKLTVYDVLGRKVATLVEEFKTTGKYHIKFDAGNLSSGTYIYQLRVNDIVETKKMLLLK